MGDGDGGGRRQQDVTGSAKNETGYLTRVFGSNDKLVWSPIVRNFYLMPNAKSERSGDKHQTVALIPVCISQMSDCGAAGDGLTECDRKRRNERIFCTKLEPPVAKPLSM